MRVRKSLSWSVVIDWVLGVGCWVLGVGCWVLGVEYSYSSVLSVSAIRVDSDFFFGRYRRLLFREQ